FKPHQLPDMREFTDTWRELAVKAGLSGLYFVGHSPYRWDPHKFGFDAVEDSALPPLIERRKWHRPFKRLKWELKRLSNRPTVYRYKDILEAFVEDTANRSTGVRRHPCVVPGWDNTPRSRANGLVLHGSHPELFRRQVRIALRHVERQDVEHRIVFLKSWNEWAEGNYVEPDLRFGKGYLEALRAEISEISEPTGATADWRAVKQAAAEPCHTDSLMKTRA
ncbi:MAG: glycoside hydrolase family 99-like domain-containing protein, partial [Acidimicrobiia bacterium]